MKIKGKNRKKILINMVVAIFLIGIIRISFFNKKDVDYKTTTDPSEIIDLSIELEDEFQLDEVRITEADRNILEIRIKTPTDVSKETLLAGTAYIFSYVEPKIDEKNKKIRIFFTVNYLDAMFIETERENIKKWIDGRIDIDEFVNKFKIVQISQEE